LSERDRGFVADRAVRSFLIVVSTLSLAFSARIVEAHEVDHARATWQASILAAPTSSRCLNGSAHQGDCGDARTLLTLDFSRPGKPTDNAFIDQ
jgi:hypothetical protein